MIFTDLLSSVVALNSVAKWRGYRADVHIVQPQCLLSLLVRVGVLSFKEILVELYETKPVDFFTWRNFDIENLVYYQLETATLQCLIILKMWKKNWYLDRCAKKYVKYVSPLFAPWSHYIGFNGSMGNSLHGAHFFLLSILSSSLFSISFMLSVVMEIDVFVLGGLLTREIWMNEVIEERRKEHVLLSIINRHW